MIFSADVVAPESSPDSFHMETPGEPNHSTEAGTSKAKATTKRFLCCITVSSGNNLDLAD
jgi:hypothetical protein